MENACRCQLAVDHRTKMALAELANCSPHLCVHLSNLSCTLLVLYTAVTWSRIQCMSNAGRYSVRHSAFR